MSEPRFTIGTDPEFFLINKEGRVISAIPHIPGTKHEPAPLPSGGTIQKDNVALEFATPPAKNRDDFVLKVGNAFRDIMIKIPEGHAIAVIPSAIFDDDQLDCPEALEFGCDPDYNAWTVSINEKPEHPNKNFRSCGGHVHVGHVPGDGNEFLLDPYGKIEVTKGMDCLHGIISVILDNSPESVERRKLYGGAGCHRPTPYGVEYRVLSNFWMKSPYLVMLVDSLTHDVLRAIKGKVLEEIINTIGENEVQDIINKGLINEARRVLERVLLNYMSKDSIHYYNVCVENVKSFDFIKEWQLEVAN